MIEPIELVNKQAAEKVIAHACGKCGVVCRNREEAVAHCESRLCKCGAVLDRSQSICRVCWKKKREVDLRALVDKAKPISAADYDGPIHWEQGDRYFSSIGEAFGALADEDVRDAVLWPCDATHLVLDAGDIIQTAMEAQEHHDGADVGDNAEGSLNVFLNFWNETYGKLVESWFPRTNEVVVIPQEWWVRYDAEQKD